MPSLSVLRDGRVIATLDLGTDPLVIGRDESADLVLDEPTVSRRHLRLTPKGSAWRLEDLDTDNGTFVNGVREWACDLDSDVTVQLGEAILLYHAESHGPHRRLEKRDPATGEILLEGEDLPSTHEMHPVQLRELQAALRIQTKPHLVVVPQPGRKGDDRYYALQRSITTLGYGPVHVPLGPARKASVLAEIHRDGADVEIHSKGLLSKVRHQGKRVSKLTLRPGARVELDGFQIIYRPGVDLGG